MLKKYKLKYLPQVTGCWKLGFLLCFGRLSKIRYSLLSQLINFENFKFLSKKKCDNFLFWLSFFRKRWMSAGYIIYSDRTYQYKYMSSLKPIIRCYLVGYGILSNFDLNVTHKKVRTQEVQKKMHYIISDLVIC